MRSALMIDGVPRVPGRLGCAAAGCCGAAAGTSGSLLLTNISPCLDEFSRIPHRIVVPHFVVDMRSGASSGRSQFPHDGTFVQLCSCCDHNFRQMAVASTDTVTVIYFYSVTVGAAGAGENDDSRRGDVNITAFFARKIDA